MTNLLTPEELNEKIILSGIHLDLTPALKTQMREKAAKLLRHEPRIVRVRLDLDHDQTRGAEAPYTAKGRIEISGPDMVAQATETDAYKAIDDVVSKLDRALRKRSADLKRKRRDVHPAEIGLGLPKTV
jgi:putative sigma-54 modulation protein